MPAEPFTDRINQQIGHEFAASQQYVSCAVHYDGHTLPRLAAFFYRQALEERNHALMMVNYLLSTGARAVIPGVAAPKADFEDLASPVRLALEQERRVSEQVAQLAALAREQGDYASEQFMQWFIKEQVEEVASMSALLEVVERELDRPMEIEEYLAREAPGDQGADPTAPAVAGGAV